MASGQAVAALAQQAWLAGLTADDVAALAALAEPFAVPAGDRLFAQNDPGDGLYLIGSGDIEVRGRTPGDGRVALSTLGPGAVLGEFSLLDGGRRSADALAASDVHGWRLGLARVAALQAAGHPAALALGAALRRLVATRSAALVAGLAGAAAALVAAGDAPALPVSGAELAAHLHSFPGFDRLSTAELAELAAAGHGLAAPRGTPLPARPLLWIVRRGALAWQTPAGLQLLVHGPGALVGAAAFVAGTPWPAQLRVREDAELFALEKMPDAGSRLGSAIAAMLGAALVRDQRRLTRVRGRIEALAMMVAA